MLLYSLSRSKKQNKKIETYSKVLGKSDVCIDQFNIKSNDEYDKNASVYKKEDFIVSDNIYDFEEILSQSDEQYHYSQYDELEEDDEILSDLSEDSNYDPETDSYEYSHSIDSELKSIGDKYNKIFTNVEMNTINENKELDRKKDLVDLMFIISILIINLVLLISHW